MPLILPRNTLYCAIIIVVYVSHNIIFAIATPIIAIKEICRLRCRYTRCQYTPIMLRRRHHCVSYAVIERVYRHVNIDTLLLSSRYVSVTRAISATPTFNALPPTFNTNSHSRRNTEGHHIAITSAHYYSALRAARAEMMLRRRHYAVTVNTRYE